MSDQDIFVQIVQGASELPDLLRTHASEAKQVTASVLAESFLSLLEMQIKQSSRGPQWADKLKDRKHAMQPYCGQRLLKGRIDIGIDVYWIQVSPDAMEVVYWELYEAYQERLS
ncbi:MAG: hypothetical protein GY809_30300 [Planctomycetes bacterium]|nr:hypothetical protein [Planctomycetota bacterium]